MYKKLNDMRWFGTFFIIFGILECSFAQVYVKSTATGANNGNSWTDAYTDVQTAIIDASNGGEDVWVAAGTYQHGSQMNLRNGVTVYGGFPNVGNPVWGDRNYTVNLTILSGNNSYRVIYNSGGGINATAIIDGCTIQDGASTTGAGIYFRNVSPIVRNCIITNNNSTNTGGGVYIRDGSPSFQNVQINSNNTANYGAGVYIRSTASPSFTNSQITNNSITNVNRYGGGFYITNTANPSITNCTITGNQSTSRGGGIYSVSLGWTNALSSNTILTNSAIGGNAYGGGIYIDNSDPNITNNEFSIKTNNIYTLIELDIC